jgi:hypothetical protein
MKVIKQSFRRSFRRKRELAKPSYKRKKRSYSQIRPWSKKWYVKHVVMYQAWYRRNRSLSKLK